MELKGFYVFLNSIKDVHVSVLYSLVGGWGQGSRWVPNEQMMLILCNWLVLYERLLKEKVKELKRWLVSCLLFTQWSEAQGSPETLTWASCSSPLIGKKQKVQQDVLHRLQTITPAKTSAGWRWCYKLCYSTFHSPNHNEGCRKAAAVKSDIHREVFTEIETSEACNNRTSFKTVFHSGWAPQRPLWDRKYQCEMWFAKVLFFKIKPSSYLLDVTNMC